MRKSAIVESAVIDSDYMSKMLRIIIKIKKILRLKYYDLLCTTHNNVKVATNVKADETVINEEHKTQLNDFLY